MHVAIVHCLVRPESVAAFILACQANHDASTREADNRRFDILQDANDPTHFVLYEAYATAEAAAAHKETGHYLTWRETVAPMMAQPREGKPFRALFPAG
jgi:(4S)-4-hydroxy-5-phosphonooxypentane-2,3-dione isomerase